LVRGAKYEKLACIVERRVPARVDDEMAVGFFHAHNVYSHAISSVEFT
jgi:hypothetical protein